MDEPYNVTKDETSHCFIQQALDDDIFYVIIESNIAKEAWESLKRVFDVRGSYMLESHPVNLAKDSQIVDEFYYVDTLVNNYNVFDVEYD